MSNRKGYTRLDLTGKRVGRLVVLRFDHIDEKFRQTRWLCRCDCGNEKLIRGTYLNQGYTRSCGCLIKETLDKLRPEQGRKLGKSNLRHGLSKIPEYNIWFAMRTRCYDERSPAFKNYGARGITVCDRWFDFENFIADMGRRPERTLTLDRINNDGHYTPSNCRWATRKEQYHNRRGRKCN